MRNKGSELRACIGRLGRGWAPGALTLALIVVTIVGVDAASPVASPPSPPPALAVAPAAPSASTATLAGEPTAVTGVTANALGPLTGNWVFAAKLKQGPFPRGTVGIWGVPLAGGAPRVAFSYEVPLAGVGPYDDVPYLRRQFSRDGTRVVVWTAVGGLVIVGLPSGRARRLQGAIGAYPSWSKDGSQISFLRPLPGGLRVPAENGLFVVPASGGAPREIADVGISWMPPEWSLDGSMIAVPVESAQPSAADEKIRIEVFQVAAAKLVRELDVPDIPGTSRSFAYWRAASPQLALTTGSSSGHAAHGAWSVVVLDSPTTAERVVASAASGDLTGACHCPSAVLPHDPRWDPASSHELLYSLDQGDTYDSVISASTHIVDVTTGKDTTLPFKAGDATWTWDGRSVVHRKDVHLARRGRPDLGPRHGQRSGAPPCGIATIHGRPLHLHRVALVLSGRRDRAGSSASGRAQPPRRSAHNSDADGRGRG